MSSLQNHWSGFITALSKSSIPSHSNTSSEKGVTGFLDLKPDNNLARYDAMNWNWAGVSASEKGVLQSRVVETEFAPYNKNVR
ncbi:MAG: hypothetical protein EB127_02130 [Alphaproteobacteria bacterium]|jgi:hypothetical protein|nr:hypothetical protein [Alphaproteobacteria bacterium]